MPFALHQELLGPSGVEYAISLDLVIPSTVSSSSDVQVLGNLVVARSNRLQVFEIRKQLASLRGDLTSEPYNLPNGHGGDGAGDSAMDDGEGFVNVGELKARTRRELASQPYETRLHLLCEHPLHGIVTGLEKIRTIASSDDGLDRLIVSFKDAKIALLEWSTAIHDLVTVSIHTYERAAQLASFDAIRHHSKLRVAPGSLCAALSLPGDALAILPFFQTQVELDAFDQDNAFMRDAPYSPSFVLDVREEVDARIKNIIDFAFLPGFSNVTIAIMYQTDQTWTGRLGERKDTTAISIITLDYVAHNYTSIARVEGLPYDCHQIIPGPILYGGVFILTTNGVLHVHQTNRVTGLPLNGWAARTSALPAFATASGTGAGGDDHKEHSASLNLMLEGARLSVLDDQSLLLILASGVAHVITIVVDGRLISKLTIGEAVARTSAPSVVQHINNQHIFVASTSGPSLLLQTSWHRVETAVDENAQVSAIDDSIDIDLDEDLYGESAYAPVPTASGSSGAVMTSDGPKRLQLSSLDSLSAWGTLNDLTFAVNHDSEQPFPELVACSGVEGTSTINRFQSHLPVQVVQNLQGLSGNVGVWSLAIRRDTVNSGRRVETSSSSRPDDTVLIVTHATPTPGLTRVLARGEAGELKGLWKIPAQTLGTGDFFQRTAIAIVTSNKIRLLNGDAKELSSLNEHDVVSAEVRDPHILVQRKDGSCAVYTGDTATGQLNETPVYTATDCLLSSLFCERHGLWKAHHPAQTNGTMVDNTSLEDVLSGDDATTWLAVTHTDGLFQILSVPFFHVVFSTHTLRELPAVLENSEHRPQKASKSEAKPNAEVLKLVIAPIGQGACGPHLTIITRTNLLVTYEAIITSSSSSPNAPFLPVKFIKKSTRALPVQSASSTIPRHLVPFTTLGNSGEELHGVFGLGIKPFWLVATRTSPVRYYASSHGVAYSFAATSALGSRRGFVLHTDQGLSVEEWAPEIRIGAELPYHSIQTERSYSAITYDMTTDTFVAASAMYRDYSLFNEEAQPLWVPDGPGVKMPKAIASAVELIDPVTWETVDGFEFPQYEHLTCLECLPLESSSTESGSKDFIVAATIIDRGEDLASRGAVYVFEIIEVVAQNEDARQFKLKLRCREDQKGPVSAICGINGYLVSSMGQKIFVRALDLDERLVGVAFLDVGVSVNSLRSVKNLLLIGDTSQGTWFVAFQEDPFKLVLLSKGRQNAAVTNADFFFGLDGRLSFISSGEDGALRALEFSPNHGASESGKKLLTRTEYHAQSEASRSLTIARRREEAEEAADPDIVSAQSILIYANTDGSITQLLALTDTTFKRLSLLQGQLIRNVQHFAGLNPRANRTVRNDTTSRPLTRGVLDASLLRAFTSQDSWKQVEMTRQIGTSAAVVFRDLGAFSDPW